MYYSKKGLDKNWVHYNSKNETNENVSSLINTIRRKYKKLRDTISSNALENDSSITIKYRVPNFYNFFSEDDKAYVLEFTLSAEHSHEHQIEYSDENEISLKKPRLYFLCLMLSEATRKRNNDEGNQIKIFHLDGNSQPIHEANRKVNPLKSNSGKYETLEKLGYSNESITLDHAEEYLDFFTSFVSSIDEKVPYLEINSYDVKKSKFLETNLYQSNSEEFELFSYHERKVRSELFFHDNLDKLPKIFQNVKERIYGLIDLIYPNVSNKDSFQSEVRVIEQWNSFQGLIDSIAEFDFAKLEKHNEQLSPNEFFDYFIKLPIRIREDLFDFLSVYFENKNNDDYQKLFDQKISIIQFGGSLYVASMKIFVNGKVEMLNDIIIDGAHKSYHYLPIGKWSFDSIPDWTDGLQALFFFPFKEGVFERALKTAVQPYLIEDTKKEWNKLKTPWLATAINGYQDKLTRSWIESRLNRSIEVEGVGFKEDVDLTGIKLDGHLVFKNCQFIRPLILNQASISGSLIFDNCIFYGIPGKDTDFSKHSIALSLENININGAFSILKSTIYGSVDCRRIKVQLTTKIRGIKIFPHYNEYQEDNPNFEYRKDIINIDRRFTDFPGISFDLRYSFFGRGLDLSAYFGTDSFNEKFSSASNENSNKKDKTKPNEICGFLVVDNSTINSYLLLSGLLIAPPNPKVFESAKAFYNVSIQNCTINGNVLFWRPIETPGSTWKSMKTYVDGDFSMNNSNIKGRIDLRSIWIGKNLRLKNIRCSGGVALTSSSQFDFDHYNQFLRFEIPDKEGIPEYDLQRGSKIKIKDHYYLAHIGRTHVIGDLDLSNSEIDGKVFLQGLYVRKRVLLIGGSYGDVDMGLRLDQLYFKENSNKEFVPDWHLWVNEKRTDCEFTNQLIKSNLDVIKKDFSTPKDNQTEGTSRVLAATLTNISEVLIIDSKINGSLNLSHCRLTGGNGKKIQSGNATLDNINSALIEGKLLHDSFEHTPLRIENVAIKGSLLFCNEKLVDDLIHDFMNDDSIAYEYFWIFEDDTNKSYKSIREKAKKIRREITRFIASSKIGNSSVIHGNLAIENLHLEGKLDFTNLKVAGVTTLNDIIVNGNIQFNTAKKKGKAGFTSQALYIDLLRNEGNTNFSRIKTFALEVINTLFNGYLEIEDVVISTQKNDSLPNSYPKGFTFKNSLIRGHFEIKKSFNVRDSFEINDVEIRGNFGSPLNSEAVIKINYTDVLINLLKVKGSFILPQIKFRKTPEKSFTIYNSEINGDLDFTQTKHNSNISGDFNILLTSVKGHLKLSEKNGIECIIRGEKIDLTASTFGKASIPIRRDDNNTNIIRSGGKWILQKTSIGHLNVIDEDIKRNSNGSYFSRNTNNSEIGSEIDFRGCKFDRLSFNEIDYEKSPQPHKIAENNDNQIHQIIGFLELGNREADDFSLEGYANVEKHLREQGRKQDANAIFSEMQGRWRRIILESPIEKNSFHVVGQKIAARVHGFIHRIFFQGLTEFGSNWFRPLLFISILFCISYLFTQNELNWSIHKINELGTHVPHDEGIQRIGSFGALKAFEISTPTISLITNYTFEDYKYVFEKENEWYIIFLKAIGWLLWPAFLLSASGILKRN